MRFILIFLIACSTLTASGNSRVFMAHAVDLEAGEQVFSANCSACHANGNNNIITEKTLKKEILKENDMNSIVAITNQVKNGKNAMPAFGGRLADEDIENVANYVLNKSESGW